MAIPKTLKKKFSKHNEVIFATTEDKQPRMRPMTLIFDPEGFFFATDSKSDKVTHIRENPKSEFILQLVNGVNHGYIRCKCSSKENTNMKLREKLFTENSFMGNHWKGYDDPEMMIIQLKPSAFYVMEPGKNNIEKMLADS